MKKSALVVTALAATLFGCYPTDGTNVPTSNLQFYLDSPAGSPSVGVTLKNCKVGEAADTKAAILMNFPSDGAFRYASTDGTSAAFGTEHDDAELHPGWGCDVNYQTELGWRLENPPTRVDVPTSAVSTYTLVQRPNAGGGGEPTNVDLPTPTAAANTAKTDLATACDLVAADVTGFLANPQTVTRETLTQHLSACVSKKSLADSRLGDLSAALARATATTLGWAAANTAKTDLATAVATAEGQISTANTALNGPTPPQGTLKLSAVTSTSGGALVEGVTFKVGTTPTDQVTCPVTTATNKVCELKLGPGTYSVVATKTGYQITNTLVTIERDGTTQAQLFLAQTVDHPPNTAAPRADFVLTRGSSVALTGFGRYDGQSAYVAVPDSEVTLTVVTGTSATVAGLTITAGTTAGTTEFKWCWNHGTPGDASDDQCQMSPGFKVVTPP